MCIDFVTVASQVIQTEQVGIVLIPLNGRKIELQNVALAIKYIFNLIFLGQLQKSEISFHDNLVSMILIKNGKIIAQVRRSQNLFVLDLATPEKVMRVSHTIETYFANNTS